VEVVKRFGGVTAVSEATLDVKEASITSLIGPNGAGKTTLFNLIAGVYRPERGTVAFAGRTISGKRPHEVARAGLVRTFQQARALTRMSVLDNMMVAGARQPGENAARVLGTPWGWHRRERELAAQAEELLALVRLDHLAGAYAGTLSGGQRKLLEFARALMPQPQMLMLDEPMAGVNPTLGRELLDHMKHLRATRGLTFLLIEHDLEVVMEVSDRIHVMGEGVVIASGTGDEVRSDARVIDAYLGAHATA
jgi:branched-chain amino acid transport system ATP-binding protein